MSHILISDVVNWNEIPNKNHILLDSSINGWFKLWYKSLKFSQVFISYIWWETPAASLCEETFWFGYRLLIWFSDPVKILEKARGISWFCAFLYILYKNCSSTWTENPRNFFRKSAMFPKCWLTPPTLLNGSTIVPHGNQKLKLLKE